MRPPASKERNSKIESQNAPHTSNEACNWGCLEGKAGCCDEPTLRSEKPRQWDWRPLHQLLVGTASQYNRESWEQSDNFTELKRGISKNGIGSVLEKVLPSFARKGSSSFTKAKWVLRTKLETSEVDEDSNLQEMKALFQHWVPCADAENGNGEDIPWMYKCARRVTVHAPESTDASSAAGKFDQMQTGDVLQALAYPNSSCPLLTQPREEEDRSQMPLYSIQLFCILGLIGWEQSSESVSQTFAIVQRCDILDSNFLRASSPRKMKLLRLQEGVRKIGLVRACSESQNSSFPCTLDHSMGTVLHGKSVLSGGKYYFYTRRNGYPPRMA